MNPTRIVEYLRDLAIAFYRSILKLSINAHQVIAHWRSRINNNNRKNFSRSSTNQGKQSTTSLTDETKLQTLGQATNSLSTTSYSISNSTAQASLVRTSQQTGLPIITPNSKRIKLYSILRRLSIRNFMEYCVIALNEASGSSSSNKFDLSSCETPVWLLGKEYDLPRSASELVDDIKTRLWITYRRNFPPIDDNSRYTTDRGFGCMIRCGQMVLANALIYKNLGRDWRWLANGIESNPLVYGKILRLFQDKEECLYSIHNIVRSGQQEGIVIGEWFGPNTIAQALKRMSLAHHKLNQPSNSDTLISIDAALDNVVVIDEIKSRFKQEQQQHQQLCNHASSPTNGDKLPETSTADDNGSKVEGNKWIPGILFIQLRLGLTKINPLYFAALKKTLQFKNSLGIIGGRPNHALYLIGYTENDIIYLDPHSTQQFVDFDSSSVTNAPEQRSSDTWADQQQQQTSPIDSTYHCACPEKMPIDRLDPSLALCFYFHNESEFDEWCISSRDLLIKIEQAPMFEIIESRSYDSCPATSDTTSTSNTSTQAILDPNASKKSDEEFELLG